MSQVFAAVTKNPNAVYDFTIDWANFLASGEVISTSTWTADTGITVDSESETTTTATAFFSGGTLNTVYGAVNTIVTDQGRTDTRTLQITVAFASSIGRVRMLAGDADTSDELMTDNQYAWALDESSDNIYGAASLIARAIAGKFARRADTSIGELRVSYSQRVTQYNDIAARMTREEVKRGGSVSVIGAPRAGGISQSAVDAVRDNTDRVQPSFRRGMFETNNPFNDDDRVG